jgi:superfamily I DNA/RNA helicase
MPSNSITFTAAQFELIEAPLDAKIFLEGPAGTGKTSVGVERLLYLIESGVPADSILLLVPQRTLAARYYQALRQPDLQAGSLVTVLTVGGLAKRMVELYWPLVAEQAGFAHPNRPPTFLTLETAQYYMAHLVRPLLSEGLFEGVTLERNRLYSQIIDNLNKAALVGFPHTEIGDRLKAAWVGDPGQAHIYEDAQHCANLFRGYCLENNLLDFSLQVEIFTNLLWQEPICKNHLYESYKHLIADNLEEHVPVSADLLYEWLPVFDSGMLIFDTQAGYRRFLGADPESTHTLVAHCDQHIRVDESFVTSEATEAFAAALEHALIPLERRPELPPSSGDSGLALSYPPHEDTRYYPQMLDWVVDQTAGLIEEGVPPGEIVVLAPYLSDALRFSLTERFDAAGIPTYSHRPSRSLRDEPATQALLTLTALAHPLWDIRPSRFDVAYTLMETIAEMDLVRAQLLAEIVYRQRKGMLSPFELINPTMQERITFKLGERYQQLYEWVESYAQSEPMEMDHFLSQLFGEVLSQSGFNFHWDYDAAEVTANLIESVQKFRWVTGDQLAAEGIPLGQEYLHMVEDGVIAAQYIYQWQAQPEDAVFLAPAYTFLLRNLPADYQFWLDVGSRGWYERIRQPLTHPYVLSRHWDKVRPWTDEEETETGQEALRHLALGLIRRCREGIYLGLSQIGEQGYEHKGKLLRAIDQALQLETSRSQPGK